MILDDQKKEQITGVFKLVAQYKEDAKQSTQSATEAMKGLVESLTADKQERKLVAKSLKKAFTEYSEEMKGDPDTLMDALDIIAVVCKGVEE